MDATSDPIEEAKAAWVLVVVKNAGVFFWFYKFSLNKCKAKVKV